MAGWGLPDEGTMVSQSRKRMSVGCWRVVFRWERWKRMTVVDGEENIEGLGSSELEENWEEEGFFYFLVTWEEEGLNKCWECEKELQHENGKLYCTVFLFLFGYKHIITLSQKRQQIGTPINLVFVFLMRIFLCKVEFWKRETRANINV